MFLAFWAIFMVGCASFQRDCASCNAENFGSDWIIVQLKADGDTARCWELRNTSVGSDSANDVHWLSSDGHLIHIEGWYNRVQVANDDFEGAYRVLGVDGSQCIR